jgi:hypothetical protein
MLQEVVEELGTAELMVLALLESAGMEEDGKAMEYQLLQTVAVVEEALEEPNPQVPHSTGELAVLVL